MKVASCRKGTARLGWEEGGVPLWGQWGERGTPGAGDTPGRAGGSLAPGEPAARASPRRTTSGGDRGTRGARGPGCAGGRQCWGPFWQPPQGNPQRPAAVPGSQTCPRRSSGHRAGPAPRGQDPVLPGGGLEKEGEEALSIPAGVPPLAPHTQHVSLGASSSFPSDAGAQSCAGRAAPALPPSLPPRPRTSRPPQSPRTPLRSGQRGNLLPRFPPRLLTICLNLLLLLF